MRHLFYRILCVSVSVLCMVACSEDEYELTGFENSTIKNHGTHRVSSFRLTYGSSQDSVINTIARMTQIGGDFVQEFDAEIVIDTASQSSEVKLTFENGVAIPDGNHVLKFDCIKHRYIVNTLGSKVSQREINDATYFDTSNFGNPLWGNGTKETPFIINNADRYNKFIACLAEDTYHGAGFYFSQASSFTWQTSESTIGTGYTSLPFAGCYDGAGYYISGINTTGISNVGLFSKLMNGAEVKNLTLQNLSLYSVPSTVGAIAAITEHTVTISNIATMGTISAEKNAGGLIGEAGGNLTITNVRPAISLIAKENVGGLIGRCKNCKLVVSDITVAAAQGAFSVGNQEASAVGGVVGLVDNASFAISSVDFDHSTINEESVAKVVYGNDYIGGIVGKLNSLSAESSIKNCEVILPIHVSKYGGGFIGIAQLNNKLTIDNSIFSGIILGGGDIGGFIGHAITTADNQLAFSNNSYVDDSNGDTFIRGANTVGGYFGYLAVKNFTLSGKNYLMDSVEGSSYVGGVAGYVDDSNITLGSSLLYTSLTTAEAQGIEVTGTTNVGGLVGRLVNSTLSGNQNLTPTSSIPSFNTQYITAIATVNGNGDGVGGAVGWCHKSNVKGISVKASVYNTSHIYTGGVVGYALFADDKKITDCTFSGLVNGGNYMGGIVGEVANKGQVVECINYGEVKSAGGGPVGGIVGKVNYDDDEPFISVCVNLGKVNGGKGDIGGIVGFVSSTNRYDWCKINKCGNYGYVVGKPSSDRSGIGGIVGKSNTKKVRVSHCANHGEVSGDGVFRGVGGVAGSLGLDDGFFTDDNLDVYECANYGKVHSSGADSYVGGIIGFQEEGNSGATDSQVRECYNCGEITSDQDENNGGIVGNADYCTTIKYCVNYGKVHHGNAMIGTKTGIADLYTSYLYYLSGTGGNWHATKSFSASEQGSQSTYEGFNFSEKWTMSGGKAILQQCPFQLLSAPQ